MESGSFKSYVCESFSVTTEWLGSIANITLFREVMCLIPTRNQSLNHYIQYCKYDKDCIVIKALQADRMSNLQRNLIDVLLLVSTNTLTFTIHWFTKCKPICLSLYALFKGATFLKMIQLPTTCSLPLLIL